MPAGRLVTYADPARIRPVTGKGKNQLLGKRPLRYWRSASAVTAFAVVGSLFTLAPPAHAGIAGRPTGRLSPATGALLGAHVEPTTGTTETDVRNAVNGLETTIGRTLDISSHAYNWGQVFPTWAESWDISKGRIPMITWDGTDVSRINSGSQDTLIRARADAVAALGTRVFLRWFPDMNAGVTPPAPAAFVSAWRRIHGIFQNRGATNAVWVWTPNAYAFTSGAAAGYYPGDAYVEWIGASGYNWAPVKPASPWRGFGEIFGDFYDWARTRGKPLMIAETGVLENGADAQGRNEKGRWLYALRNALKNGHPAIQAFVYTHARKTYPEFAGTYDWRVTTSTGASREFTWLARDPYFHRPKGKWLGAYVKPANWNQTTVKNTITGTETKIGRKLDIDHHFYAWGATLPSWKESWDATNGRTPMISWGPSDVTRINSGALDGYITARADALAAFGKPVYLRWFYEADTSQLAPLAGSPAAYVNAWQRIHGIFRDRGAHNVMFVWCMTAYGFKLGDSQRYYPGDQYVDWIAADAYNWAPGKPDAKWHQLKDLLPAYYSWAVSHNRPLMVAETGAQERAAGEKATWITNMRNALKNTYPRITALVWLHAVASSYEGGSYNWKIDTSSSSLTAFKNMAADPAFRK